MRAVDTNVLVRLVARDDPKQANTAEKFVQGGTWVFHLVLMEATWVLDAVYGVRASGIASAIEMLLNHEHISVQDGDVVAAALAQFRAKPALGFSDCLMLAVARKAGHLPLGTFDKNLGKLDGAQRL